MDANIYKTAAALSIQCPQNKVKTAEIDTITLGRKGVTDETESRWRYLIAVSTVIHISDFYSFFPQQSSKLIYYSDISPH